MDKIAARGQNLGNHGTEIEGRRYIRGRNVGMTTKRQGYFRKPPSEVDLIYRAIVENNSPTVKALIRRTKSTGLLGDIIESNHPGVSADIKDLARCRIHVLRKNIAALKSLAQTEEATSWPARRYALEYLAAKAPEGFAETLEKLTAEILLTTNIELIQFLSAHPKPANGLQSIPLSRLEALIGTATLTSRQYHAIASDHRLPMPLRNQAGANLIAQNASSKSALRNIAGDDAMPVKTAEAAWSKLGLWDKIRFYFSV